MKKLILSLILIPFLASADETQKFDKAVEKKFLSVVKDTEVERLMGSSAEFNECRDLNKFEKNSPNKERNLQAATTCLQGKIGNKKGDALKKLAEDLKLHDYGLIKSKSVTDITDYLAKKLRKSLTGSNSDDKNYGQQKWEDTKIVDQKVFIELYQSQLAKNSLFEISRFCFENLRLKSPKQVGPDGLDFTTYWGGTKGIAELTDKDMTDTGGDIFLANKLDKVDLSDDGAVYGQLISGLTPDGKKIDSEFYGVFYKKCMLVIKPLCEDFKTASHIAPATTPIPAADPTAAPAPVVPAAAVTMTRGSSACLTMNKLESIRATIRNTEQVAKQFDEMEDKGTFALQMLKNPKIYASGKDGEETYDQLTSVGSSDFLQGNDDEAMAKLEADCAGGGTSSECEKFLEVNDGLDKAINDVETNLTFKREIEVKRVKELKNQDLKDYLKENRHFDLLERLGKTGDDGLTDESIALEIEKYYDAKKLAEIETLKLKLGKRQVNDAENDQLKNDDTRADRITENIKASKEERARLAQVVMFNNIITSQLDLSKQIGKDKFESVGRNVGGWNKEKIGLDKVEGIDTDIFEGIQSGADEFGSKTKETFKDVGYLDNILGKDTSKPEE